MFFFATSVLMAALAVQRKIVGQPQHIKGLRMMIFHVGRNIFHGNSLDAADGVGKIFINDFPADADGFKNLRSLVGLQGRNAHLGRDLYDTM